MGVAPPADKEKLGVAPPADKKKLGCGAGCHRRRAQVFKIIGIRIAWYKPGKIAVQNLD